MASLADMPANDNEMRNQPDESLAIALREKLVHETIAALEGMGEGCLLSGEDSGLKSVWEEICVQVRGEESYFWDTYIDTIDSLIEGAVDALPLNERRCLWLSTDAGCDWLIDCECEDDDPNTSPIVDADIVDELRWTVLSAAADYECSRVDRYLNSHYADENGDGEEDSAVEDGECNGRDQDAREDNFGGDGKRAAKDAGEEMACAIDELVALLTPKPDTLDSGRETDKHGPEMLHEMTIRTFAGNAVSTQVGFALVRDCLRAFHEVFIKAGENQSELLSQVHATLGETPARQLAQIIHADQLNYSLLLLSPLQDSIEKLSAERGISFQQGAAILSGFLGDLMDVCFDKYGCRKSPTFMTYLVVGDEAAYHLGGLYIGDDGDDVSTEMAFLDGRLKRFYTVVERWRMEAAWDKEDSE